jgi:exopolysaccharide production protein ExoQ
VAVLFYLVMVTPVQRRIVWLLMGGMLWGGGLLFLALEPYSGSRLEALAKLGRNDPQADPRSLTGRLPIWTQIVTDIQERPALGYGYAAYWTADRVHRLSYIHDWEFSNAHSSYLEMILAVGLVGFALGLVAVIAVFARGMWLYSKSTDLGLLFVLSIFVMAFVSGLIESTFVSVGYEYVVWLAGAFIIVYFPLRSRASSRLLGAVA